MSISPSVGRQIKVIRKQGATWNTEPTGEYAIWSIREDGLGFTQNLDDIEEGNSTWVKDADVGLHSASFAPKETLRFDNIVGLALCMGTANYLAVTASNAGKGDYVHQFMPDEDITGFYESIGIQKGARIQTLHSVKYRGFTITGQPDPQRIEITHDTLVSRFNNASTVNTAAAFTGATAEPTGNGGRGFFRNLTVRLADQCAGTALASGDAITDLISDLEFNFGRDLTEDHTNDSGLYIAEPDENGYPTATLRLNFKGLTSTGDTAITNLFSNTAKMFDLEIVGNAASTATGTVDLAKLYIEAPRAKIIESEPGANAGPGRLPSSILLKLYAPDTTSDAEDMDFDEPFRLTVINNQAAKVIS